MFKSSKYKRLESDYHQLEKEYEKLESRLVSLLWDKEKFKLANNLLEKYQLLGIAENNQKHKYYVCLATPRNSVNISFRDSKRVNHNPRILTDICFDDKSEEKYCYIIDMFAVDENVGNGSILLDYLFEHLKKMNIKKVTGRLSSVDKEDFDKLEYFYKKNGFEVTFNTGKTEGYIEKLL